eukprot:TRINITY_DN12818_c0_g1_i3.p1 TRINITY_DN12818_c0_g1~~TRINITY_DN12818_c0_g1_i3.p1  ORF type:complete len:280 (+),score=64.22 TRINITY_DN12818_c0_g1_i3:77-916(+)
MCIRDRNKKVCYKCANGKYLLEGSCLNSCPKGFYGDANEGVCAECGEACLQCFGSSNRQCYSCNSELGYIMIADNTCNYPSCIDGSYFDVSQKACTVCPKECSKCYGEQNCTECIQGYNFDYAKKKCYDPCDKAGFRRKANSFECEEICGDGKNMGTHECDDGNTKDNDGCSSKCTIEPYYKCSGGNRDSPDVCVYRKAADVATFKYSTDRTATVVFDIRLRLLGSIEDAIEFTMPRAESPLVKWTHEPFNKNRFTSIKFKFEFTCSLIGTEVDLGSKR